MTGIRYMRPATWILLAVALSSCGSSGETQNAAAKAETRAEDCSRFYPGGKPPQVTDQRMAQKTRPMCRLAFAGLHSGIVRQPLWIAEMVNEGAVKAGKNVARVDAFHPDERIPADERAELSDYSRSGYDRGHMAPDADMPSVASAHEAMALSNMSPQKPGLNRGSWADLEKSVRQQTRGGPVYVVTGPLFLGTTLATTHKNRRLAVPTHFYKAMYAEFRGAAVFIASNEEKPRWSTLSVDQFSKVHGIDPFPGLEPGYRTVNGTTDGSLQGPTPKGGTKATGKTAVDPEDELVRSPRTGQMMTRRRYREYYGEPPPPQGTNR